MKAKSIIFAGHVFEHTICKCKRHPLVVDLEQAGIIFNALREKSVEFWDTLGIVFMPFDFSAFLIFNRQRIRVTDLNYVAALGIDPMARACA